MNPRDVFEIVSHTAEYDRRVLIEWRSNVFDLRQGITLRDDWTYRCDPRRLIQYIERLVGRTLQNFADLRVYEGRIMVRDLLPHFEREIYFEMERMERESMRRYVGVDYASGSDFTTVSVREMGRFRFVDTYGPPPIDEKAKQKARQLLLRNLDAGQEKSFKQNGTFRVTAKNGQVYTISTQRSFNVTGDDGKRYCGQLVDTPIEDQMLAQKLLLEHEPEKFFSNANVSSSGAVGAAGFILDDQSAILTVGGRRQWHP